MINGFRPTARVLLTIVMVALVIVQSRASVTEQPLRVTGFVLNVGQWADSVVALARTPALDVWITTQSIWFDHFHQDTSVRTGHAVRATWINANGTGHVAPHGAPECQVNYIKGANINSTTFEAGVYQGVSLENVYAGITIHYRIVGGRFRFDLEADSHVLTSNVGLRLEGYADVEGRDDLITIKTNLGDVWLDKLRVNEHANVERIIPASFRYNNDKATITFELTDRDIANPVTIDPVVFATLYGDNTTQIADMELDSKGNLIFAGWTTETRIPRVPGGYEETSYGYQEAFVARVNSALSKVDRFTFMGGSNDDRARAITLDAADNVYVTGQTLSSEFPVVAGSANTLYTAGIDAFVVKLDSNLRRMITGLFVGGNKDDIPYDIALDQSGNIYICGSTTSNVDFPVMNGYQRNHRGQEDGFITRIGSSGTAIHYSTYFGDEGVDIFRAMTVTTPGEVLVTGSTTSTTLASRFVGALSYNLIFGGGDVDAFLIQFSANNADIQVASYVGGSGVDIGMGIYVDHQNRIYVVGETTSPNLPENAGTIQTGLGGGRDAFVSGYGRTANLLQCIGSSYYGGLGNEDIRNVRHNGQGTFLIVGRTASLNLPTEGIGAHTQLMGLTDGFAAVASLFKLESATFIGGEGHEDIYCAVWDNNADYYLAGVTTSGLFSDYEHALQDSGSSPVPFLAKYASGYLEITYPRGGERLCLDREYVLTWGVHGMRDKDRYVIELSSDGGITWSSIAENISTSRYTWKTPSTLRPDSSYRLRIHSGRGHMAEMKNVFRIIGPPVIARFPQTVYTVCEGDSLFLSAEIRGSQLRHQWYFGSQPIPGATWPVLSLNSLIPGQSGLYSLRVTGECEVTAESEPITLTVQPVTRIAAQPVNTNLVLGEPFNISIVAEGGALTYQWYRNGTAIPAPGGVGPAYSVLVAQNFDIGDYWCVVSGACGATTSDTVKVGINVGVDYSFEHNQYHCKPLIEITVEAGTLSMEFNEVPGEALSIMIRDLTGRIVSAQLWNPSEKWMRIPMHEISTGAYLLTVEGGRHRCSQSILYFGAAR